MTEATIQRITLHTVLFGIALGVFAMATMGTWRGVSVLAATGIVVVNWFVLRWIVRKVVGGNVRRQSGLMILLIAKMGVLFAAAYLLLRYRVVEPIGFLMGVGALVLGSFTGSFSVMFGGTADRK